MQYEPRLLGALLQRVVVLSPLCSPRRVCWSRRGVVGGDGGERRSNERAAGAAQGSGMVVRPEGISRGGSKTVQRQIRD
jgi:hypothetical protein